MRSTDPYMDRPGDVWTAVFACDSGAREYCFFLGAEVINGPRWTGAL